MQNNKKSNITANNTTMLSEGELHGIHFPEDLDRVLQSLDITIRITLPIIDANWFGWEQLAIFARKNAAVFNVTIFQDEIYKYQDLQNCFNFNILIYKKLAPLELEWIKEIQKQFLNISFIFLVNKSWPAEEVLKSLPHYIRNELCLNYKNGLIKSRLSEFEQQNFTNRTLLNLGNTSILEGPIPYGHINSRLLEMDNKTFSRSTKSLFPNLKETSNLFKSQYHAVKYFLSTNPLLFVLSATYSSYRILQESLYPLRFFVFKTLPLRTKGNYFRLIGSINKAKGNIIHNWWKYGSPVRKIYYVFKYHYLNRSKLPKKLLLVLTGRMRPW